MPQRKEPKETVVYAASKRKPPPFKPLRPSKLPKSAELQTRSPSVISQPLQKASAPKSARRITLPDSDGAERDDDDTSNDDHDDSDEIANEHDINNLIKNPSSKNSEGSHSDGEDLPELPPPSKFGSTNGKTISYQPPKPLPAKRKAIREASPLSVTSNDSSTHPATTGDPSSSQSVPVPSIPQPLLVRLLHERFQDKTTQIDKHAIQVVQKYVEIFVREAIARTALVKREEADKGTVSHLEGKWLELEDLEKVAPGLLVDF